MIYNLFLGYDVIYMIYMCRMHQPEYRRTFAKIWYGIITYVSIDKNDLFCLRWDAYPNSNEDNLDRHVINFLPVYRDGLGTVGVILYSHHTPKTF